MAHFFSAFAQTFTYVAIDCPESCTALSRTTHLLERCHKERRRTQRDIGMFQSEQGCEALWYLRASRETAKQQAMLQSRV
jgi:transposase-like protein